MIAAEQAYRRAHQWFRRAPDDPRCRAGAWLCATALGEPAGPVPDLVLPVASRCSDQPPAPVRADPACLLRLAEQITDQTGFGRTTDRIPTDRLTGWATALPVAVTLAVRARDLAVTSALLLAGACLHCGGHPQLRHAAAFVAAQQQPDGGFGALPPDADAALCSTVRVPLTFGCVWALVAVGYGLHDRDLGAQ
ncbi:MAG: DUF6895 family protein [Pseudonocardiaceae bacterium]